MTCGTCKHWSDAFLPHPLDPMDWGGCMLTRMEGEGTADMQKEYWNTKAYAFGFFPDSDQFTRLILITKSDFGCVQYEEKLCVTTSAANKEFLG
jgi:hypothetical protein